MSTNALQKQKFSVALQTDGYQRLISNTLVDPQRRRQFIASITSAVSVNPGLQECDASTILSAAFLGESLNLSPSPQLGQYYLVPFKKNRKVGNDWVADSVRATFVLGYKGYIQLAIRSGLYRNINVTEIKKGELAKWNPLSEEISLIPIDDEVKREAAETIGYYAMLEYINGFVKSMYWSKKKMLQHANRYSPAFSLAGYNKYQTLSDREKSANAYSSFWYKDFDAMAKKTMIRQLISHWGVMSIEMQQAFDGDGTQGNGEPKEPQNENRATLADTPCTISMDDL